MRQNAIVVKPHIVGFGIACIDYIYVAEAAEPGGFSSIVDYVVEGGGLTGTAIVAAARLGAQAKLLTRVGDDEVGDQIITGLTSENVDTSCVIRVPGGKSYFSIVHVDAKTAERTIYGRMEKDINCSTDLIRLDALDSADAVILDHHWMDGSRAVARRARELGIPVVVDMSLKPGTSDLAGMCDYPVIPRNAALRFADTRDYSKALQAIHSLGSKAAIITCGSEGAYYSDETGAGHVPAFPIDAVDTTGAGDVFHGAFAFGIALGWGLRDVIMFASAVSAIKCTQVGGRTGIPTFDQVNTFLAERGVAFHSI